MREKTSRINVNIMKDYNKRLVLRTIQNDGPISRVDIATKINLSRPSVSEIINDLLNEEWIEELAPENKGRGRQPIPLDINRYKKLLIGLEIGAYTNKIVVMNLKADIFESYDFDVEDTCSPEEAIQFMAEKINEIKQRLLASQYEIIGLGVGMHGIVDAKTGTSIFAPNLGWKNIDVKTILEQHTQLLVKVDNDCNSSALAEMWFGKGRHEENFITVIADYGVGASVINDGKIFQGAHSVSGQIGHITIDPNGQKCSCGNYGCLETLISEKAILSQLKQSLKLGVHSELQQYHNIDDVTLQDFFEGVQAGDDLCVSLADSIARNLGLGISILINLFGPKFIVLGGSLSTIANALTPIISEVIELKALGDVAKRTPIYFSEMGQDLYSIGAASLIIEEMYALNNQ